MEAVAKARFQRISPRKARVVLNMVRGKNVAEALNELRFTTKSAAPIVAKHGKPAAREGAALPGPSPARGDPLTRLRMRGLGRTDGRQPGRGGLSSGASGNT